jgi:GT2 family glycosyltransferase/glycosyltransferase involved in cell wall biosynthesis
MIYSAYIESVERGKRFIIVRGWVKVSGHQEFFLVIPNILSQKIKNFYPRQDLMQLPDLDGKALAFSEIINYTTRDDHLTIAIYEASRKNIIASFHIKVADFQPKGFIEQVTATEISGWVFNPDADFIPNQNQIIIDEMQFVLQVAGTRKDIQDSIGSHAASVLFLVKSIDLKTLFQKKGLKQNEELNIALVSGGKKISVVQYRPNTNVQCRVERITDTGVYGWAVDLEDKNYPVKVTLLLDDVRYQTVQADRPRTDLRDKGISDTCGGFRFPIRIAPMRSQKTYRLSLEVAGQPVSPPQHFQEIHFESDRQSSYVCNANLRGIAIVIPVFNAAQQFKECIDSVLKYRLSDAKVIIINDASTDPRIDEICIKIKSLPGIMIVKNKSNLGFVKSANLGMRLARRSDVLLLNSDTIVGPLFLMKLQAAAYSTKSVGTVTPSSNSAGVFSVPEINVVNALPENAGVEDMARYFLQNVASDPVEVPVGHGFCLFIRYECRSTVGFFDSDAFPKGYGEEVDFCVRATNAGFSHVWAPDVYVFHHQGASFGEAKDELYEAGQSVIRDRYPWFKKMTRPFFEGEDALAARWQIRKAISNFLVKPRRRILFVISTETGGTPQTNLDLMKAIDEGYEPWLLRSDGRKLTLSTLMDKRLKIIEMTCLSNEVDYFSHDSVSYKKEIDRILRQYVFEIVHVRHMAWHGISLLETSHRMGIPVVFSFHDFYTVCPSVKLINDDCQPCCLVGSCREEGCTPELWDANKSGKISKPFVKQWRKNWNAAFAFVNQFVTTSDSAHEIICRNFPALRKRPFAVVPHGRDFARFIEPKSIELRNTSEKVKILVLGNISRAKGALLVNQLADLDGGKRVEFHVVGDSGRLSAKPGLVLHGRYERENLLSIMQDICPECGVVFSLWPETYCHTLTEMWAMGLPVFALDSGAVGERMRSSEAGWLLPVDASAEEILAKILVEWHNIETWIEKIGKVKRWQEVIGVHHSTEFMAVRYRELYRGLLDKG